MTVELTHEQYEALRAIDSCTIANAIEPFKVRHRLEGYAGPEIKCLYPDMGVMLGYAVTAKIKTVLSDRPIAREHWFNFLEEMQRIPEPRVLVMEDESDPPCHACFHGDITGNTHKRVGIIGLVTNGAVRDLDEVRKIPFFYFAPGTVVSHGKIEITEYMVPVNVGGMLVKPGDLIHGDKHGTIHIPDEIAKQVAESARKVTETEAGHLDLIHSADFTLAKLRARMEGK